MRILHVDQQKSPLRSVLSGIMAVVLILFGTLLGAEQIAKSTLYQQSQFVSSLVSQDSLSVGSMLSDRRNIELFVNFLGAVTTAYINFEMIPVNEANTFVVVFESLRDTVTVEKFEYHGKNLTIIGTAEKEKDYRQFLQSLQDKGYFESVAGHSYLTTEDTVRFEIECTAAHSATYLELTNNLLTPLYLFHSF